MNTGTVKFFNESKGFGRSAYFNPKELGLDKTARVVVTALNGVPGTPSGKMKGKVKFFNETKGFGRFLAPGRGTSRPLIAQGG